jgi:RHS repeat-associated protein
VPALYTSTTGAAIATPAYTLPGFPGQYRTYADLYYNKYRDYDTSTGRYIQADPIGLAGGASPYSYALGNPVRYTDRDGLIVDTVIDVGSVLYDLYRIGKDNIFGDNCDPDSLRTNLTALGLDLGAMVVPFVTGLGAASRAAKAFSKEKEALVDMAKIDERKGVRRSDMDAYQDLNAGLPDPFPADKVRIDEGHPSRRPHSQVPHGHVGPVDHIPIVDP